MTASDAPVLTPPPDSSSLEDALLSLIDLVDRRFDDDTDVVRALRRAVAGKHRPQDESLLAGRFQGSRLCLIRCPRIWARAIEAEAGFDETRAAHHPRHRTRPRRRTQGCGWCQYRP